MKHIRILTLEHGDFQIWSAPRGLYNVYVRKSDGSFSVNMNVREEELDSMIRAWSTVKHVYHWL